MAQGASGFFKGGTVVGNLRPAAQIIQWDPKQVNPSGFRHFESGVFKTEAKIGLVGGFEAQHASGTPLTFADKEIDDTIEMSGFLTNTVVFTFNLGQVNKNPNNNFAQASGINTNFQTFNLRFWVDELSAFTNVGNPKPVFHYLTSAEWRRNFKLTNTTTGALTVPSSFPDLQNIFSKAPETPFMSGNAIDAEHSHFVYVVGQFPSGEYKLGTFGGLGLGTFTFKFSYDWTNIDTNVLLTDLPDCPLPFVGPSSVPTPPPGVEETIVSGVVSFWNLDEQGGDRIDCIGSNDLTDVNGMSAVSGVSTVTASGALFDETNEDYLMNGTPTDLNNDDFTISFWVKFNSFNSPVDNLVVKWDDDIPQIEYLIRYDDGDYFQFFVSDDGTGVGNSINATNFGTVSAGDWHMVTCWHDSINDEMGIQVDDGTPNTESYAGGVFQGARPFILGHREDTVTLVWLDGVMDSVGFWDRVLTSAEITYLYNSGSGRTCNASGKIV